jgi:protein phosphatase
LLIWTSAHVTDVGTRRKINEDSVLEMPSQGFWVVADGMGGHAAGDYASQSITRLLAELQVRNRPVADIVDDIEDRLTELNHTLQDYARQQQAAVVGSTVVILLLTTDVGVCIWVGDSRLYQFRNHEVKCISRDHSLVQTLIERGEIKPEDARNHPSRNVITRAVGADRTVFSEMRVFKPQAGDAYILCSDGLYGEVHEMDMLDIVNGLNPRDAAEALLSVALTDGADDNVSLVVVKIRE